MINITLVCGEGQQLTALKITYHSLESDCDIVGIDYKDIDNITVRDVIRAYRKEALKVHPDKAGEEDKEKATKAFQALNSSYERILRFIIDKPKDDKDEEDENEEDTENQETRFMEDNFKNFNFPKENEGSFTVQIQHAQADSWQGSLENEKMKNEMKK